MVIGVISDTHILSNGRAYKQKKQKSNAIDILYDIINPHFKKVEMVLHAGDIADISVLEMLQQFGEVYAVAGNMDPDPLTDILPEMRVLECNGFRLGIRHGWGSSNNLAAKIRQSFAGVNLDCIVFGHSHYPYNRIEDGILMFNPGSPTEKRSAPMRSIGILYIQEKIWGEHIRLD